MRLRAHLVLACLVLVTLLGHAAVVEPQLATGLREPTLAIYGVGNSSGGSWLEGRDGARRNRSDVRVLQFNSWVDGYLSGYDMWGASPGRDAEIRKTDQAGMAVFLDNWCRVQPTATFQTAVQAFVVDQLKR